MNQFTISSELLIRNVYTKDNLYEVNLALIQYIKAKTLTSLLIDSVEVLDMDNFLFVNVEKEITSIKISHVNLKNSKNSVV